MNGILLLPNFEWLNTLKIDYWKFDICVTIIKLCYWLQSQNDSAMWHHNVFYNYAIININL
jgi:hypothetical protein